MVRVCREIFHEVCISATGDVVCSCIDGVGIRPLGNITNNRIYDIFQNDKYVTLREELLNSDDTTLCHALGVNYPFKNQPASNFDQRRDNIDKIRLETSSCCNLRCPSCIVPNWMKEKSHPRLAKLPIDKIDEVLTDTKDTLKDIWIYNYGEPFLDKRFLDILRLCKKIAPKAWIYTHTNGTAIPESWIKQIVADGLLNGISFSIDGACQDSYGKYRIGGSFDVAFNNMLKFIKSKKIWASLTLTFTGNISFLSGMILTRN